MARHNIVNIYGSILDDPVISKDEQGNFKKGMAYITLIRGFRDAGYEENSLRYDCPMLFSGNPDVVEQMSGIHKNDIVEVKGVFTVMNSAKATRCSTCSHKNRIMGEMSFITPLFFDIRKTGLTEAESLNDLKAHMEISNQVLLIGDLCRDVTFYGNNKMFQASYPLAVNRKYYLNDGRLNDRTDYIHIVSFGENAKNDASALHTGSGVLVDGRLQVRQFLRSHTCENCGTEYQWQDYTAEVIPYSTEYLYNYNTPEMIEQKEKAALSEAKKEIFG